MIKDGWCHGSARLQRFIGKETISVDEGILEHKNEGNNQSQQIVEYIAFCNEILHKSNISSECCFTTCLKYFSFTDTELRNFAQLISQSSTCAAALTTLFTCQRATGETLLSWLRGRSLQPSQICGLLIPRQDSRNTISEWTSALAPWGRTLSVTWRLYISTKEVRGRDQTSLLGAVRPLHQQCGGAGQPPQDPRRSGGCEGRAEDAGRCPQCFVMMVPTTICLSLLLFASSPAVLRNLCQDWYVPLPVLFLQLQCRFTWFTALFDAGW